MNFSHIIYLMETAFTIIKSRALTNSNPDLCFWNLQEFQICFQSPTNCTLFDIAAFLKKYCPSLEKISIDINDFTFEPYILWELYQKPMVQNGNYPLNSIKYVEIMGYKNGWHELDIVEFFVRNAKSLEKLKLIEPRNPEVTVFEPEYERITNIKRLSPKKDLIEFTKSGRAQS
ncbi:unnamed protein product [Thlaspi arvense]|uniref:FBD domain-containing protein n=1 Tax=Thlaspi arvense TaxID=13288 RepID=A0AAU9RR28_THLAR|nr:unnamed protein product [Thlaspi arvense]